MKDVKFLSHELMKNTRLFDESVNFFFQIVSFLSNMCLVNIGFGLCSINLVQNSLRILKWFRHYISLRLQSQVLQSRFPNTPFHTLWFPSGFVLFDPSSLHTRLVLSLSWHLPGYHSLVSSESCPSLESSRHETPSVRPSLSRPRGPLGRDVGVETPPLFGVVSTGGRPSSVPRPADESPVP